MEGQPGAVAMVDPRRAGDGVLHADRFGLSIGPVSVGLPPACSTDLVLLRYLDLRRLVDPDSGAPIVAPREDLNELASATTLSTDVVGRRLSRLQR